MYQTSKIKRFVKILNNKKPLTIFAKSLILDVSWSSEYAYTVINVD